MACAIEAVPRADIDQDGAEAQAEAWAEAWADEEYLPEGAHWDEDCPLPAETWAGVSVGDALAELHHQAHGPGSLITCRAEPCRKLGLEQIRCITGAT